MPRFRSILLALMLPSVLTAQAPSWTRVEGAVVEPTTSLLETSGWTLVSDGERLWRERRHHRRELTVVPNSGLGGVRDLAGDPAGPTFIAAGHGLFVISPDVTNIDVVDLGDGAPPGAPLGVHVDAQRRLWLATESSFGCLDPAYFWGRTFTAADGVPAPPYRALGADDDGLLLAAADGVYRYRPGSGEGPRGTVKRVDGRPWSGAPVSIRYPGELDVEMDGSGRGGVTFRYYRDGHHILRDLDGRRRTFETFAPGDRTIAIVAIDRDLRRSEPVVIPVTSEFPIYLETRFLVAVGLSIVALVGLLFFLLARRREPTRRGYAKAAISTAVATCLGLQILAGLFPHSRGWPFVGFSMYTYVHRQDEVTSDVLMTRILPDGRRRHLPIGDFGIAVDSAWQVIRPIMHGDASVRAAMLDACRTHGQEQTRGYQVIARRRRLTADGPVRVATLVMTHYDPEGS